MPTIATGRAVVGSLTHGWVQMLTVPLPAAPTIGTTFVPLVGTVLAAAATARAVVRSQRPVAPVLPVLILYVFALFTSAARPVHSFSLSVAVMVSCGALAWSTVALRRGSLGGQPWRAGIVLVVVLLVGVTAAAFLPERPGDRFDPRTLLPVVIDTHETVSPLSGVKPQLEGPERDLFTVEISGDSVDRVRTATLERYDGVIWASDARFAPVGTDLRHGQMPTRHREEGARIVISELTGPYLPLPSNAAEIQGVHALTAPQQGTAVVAGVLERGTEYDVVFLVDEVPPARETRTPPAGPAQPFGVGEPELAELVNEVREITATSPTPFGGLIALRDSFQARPYSLSAPPGHSLGRMQALVGTGQRNLPTHAEQNAAGMALCARIHGFPSRVAVGYLLDPRHRRGDQFRVTTHDAHAWVEVLVPDHGWVTLDPTDPQRRGTSSVANSGGPDQPRSRPADYVGPGAPTHEQPPSTGQTSGPQGRSANWLPWAVLTVVALSLAVPVHNLAVRRARRRTAPDRAVTWAWRDALATLSRFGVPIDTAMSPSQAVAEARTRLAELAEPVAALAPLITRSVFGPEEPDAQLAHSAWSHADRLRSTLRREFGPLPLVRAVLDPRPLAWRLSVSFVATRSGSDKP